MKFLPVALSGLFLSSFTSAKSFNKNLGKNKVLNKKKLMRGARRYKNGKILERKLDDNEFEITGDYSIQFSQCVSLKTNPEEMFENLYQSAYQGQILAERSYVIFNVCQTQYCSYDADEMLFVTDLGNYVGALAEFLPTQKENICNACQEHEDECNGNAQEEQEQEENDEEENQEDEEDEEEDGDRKRKLAKRKLAGNYIDCDQCYAYGCFDEEEEQNGDDQIEDEDIVGWIQEVAECKEAEDQQWNDDNGLYAGFICNSYGTGVEIAAFVDEDCTMYTPTISFANIMDQDDQLYYQESSNMVTYPFINDLDCVGEIEYDDPYEDDNGDDNNDDEAPEANEACQNLFDEDTVDLENCGDEEEEEEEEENDENQVNYDWYEYDIDDEKAEEIENVCRYLQEYEGEFSSVYQDTDDASGSFYDYTVYDAEEEVTASSGRASTAQIIGIVVLVVAVAIAAVFAVKAMTKSSEDSKKEPLTKKPGGAMA